MNDSQNKISCEKLGMPRTKESACYMDSVIFALLALPNDYIEGKLLRDPDSSSSFCKANMRSIENTPCITPCKYGEYGGTPGEGYTEYVYECPVKEGWFFGLGPRTWEECYDSEVGDNERFTDEVRNTVRGYLKRYQESIRSEKEAAPQCSDWTKKVRTCGFEKIGDDPIEFLLWLLLLFGLEDSVVKRSLPPDASESIEDIIHNDKQKLSSRYLIVAPGNEPVKKVNESVTLDDDSQLDLQSIVLHSKGDNGGRYVCFFKCHDRWYEHNDTGEIALLGDNGTFQDMINYGTKYEYEGILYFYKEQLASTPNMRSMEKRMKRMERRRLEAERNRITEQRPLEAEAERKRIAEQRLAGQRLGEKSAEKRRGLQFRDALLARLKAKGKG